MISIQRIMKSLVSQLGFTSQVERKNTHVFCSSQNFTLSTTKHRNWRLLLRVEDTVHIDHKGNHPTSDFFKFFSRFFCPFVVCCFSLPTKAKFRRRTSSHEPNRMLIRENKGLFSVHSIGLMWSTGSELGLRAEFKLMNHVWCFTWWCNKRV